ncbi:hypothetical protein Klosneuvirus_3_209 [Klosneuvirus KNV1]|uniref:Uncharacterized protein n=1 Tax=Klosneuvirus KNV1 TaxID=1977640 RepID=A0A1V0SKC5_9VIRU|nr:hypothetical protein Klosneuvirus_3_209 [Klosneuvirus KNV1]
MSVPILVQAANEINKHRNILNVWKTFGESNPFYLEAKKLLDDTLDIKLKDFESRETVYEFKMKMNIIYIKYFGKECSMTPEEVIDDWITRARKCTRVSTNGYYGYSVFYNPNTNKSKLSTNFFWENSYCDYLISEADINKIILTDLEKLAKEIVGCTITISDEKKKYYYYDD